MGASRESRDGRDRRRRRSSARGSGGGRVCSRQAGQSAALVLHRSTWWRRASHVVVSARMSRANTAASIAPGVSTHNLTRGLLRRRRAGSLGRSGWHQPPRLIIRLYGARRRRFNPFAWEMSHPPRPEE